MKSKITFSLVMLVLLSTTNVSAKIFRLGLKGGVNMAEVSFADLPSNFETSNLTGFHVGPMLEFNVPIIGLGLEGAMLYSQKGFKIDSYTMKTSNIDVPVNLKWKFGLPILKVFVAAGPYFSFGLGSTSKSPNNLTYSLEQNATTVGANIGGGVELFNHLQLGLSYAFGFTNAYDIKINEMISSKGSKDRVLSISAAYLF